MSLVQSLRRPPSSPHRPFDIGAPLPLPRHVERRSFKSGKRGYYFTIPTKAKKAGCPMRNEALGADYEAAVKCAEIIVLPAFDAWLSDGRKLPPASSLPGGIVAKRGVDPNAVQPLIGVYLLLLKGKIIYIGFRLHMPRRVADHRSNGQARPAITSR
jgi:hypothetical protein